MSGDDPTGIDFDVSGVRVLITGATNGLGLAMAGALVAGGGRVAVSGRDPAHIDAAVEVVRSAGDGDVVGVLLDVRDDVSVEAGVSAAADALGGLDVVVNNAALGMRSVNPRFLIEAQGFWDVTPDGFRAAIDTNLTGYFLVARAAVPYLCESRPWRPGRLVNISMNHATMRRRGFVPYGPSRAATEALSHVMAADLVELGITVNMLLPGGATLTGMTPDAEGQVRDRLLPASIMSRPIRWLCSPGAEGVSDERLVATEFEDWLAARTGS